jgi:uncharacterized membrane protein
MSIWVWVAITVVSGAVGDVVSAWGMAQEGAQTGYKSPGIAGRLRFIFTHPAVVGGIACNAVSFVSFIALLSVSDLTFAVPVTASGYILRTLMAKFVLREYVNWERWAGVVLVAVGVLLIAL